MTASPAELAAMRQAIAASALGLGTTSPNPPVGCVILDRDERIAGVGYHQRKGEPHAEAHALAAAGQRARGGTAVVTLEPCNHVGVTPACRQLLLAAGIARVVIALMDPTSRGDGGAAVLAANGVSVDASVLADEARLVLGPWLIATRRQRPFVTLYRVSGASVEQVDTAVVADLRGAADVVVFPDGRIEEGIPNGHGTGRLHLPHRSLDPAAVGPYLTTCYNGGVRRILIVGDTPVARALLTHGLVDCVVTDLHRQETMPPAVDPLREAVPAGFTTINIASIANGIRVTSHPPSQRPEPRTLTSASPLA